MTAHRAAPKSDSGRDEMGAELRHDPSLRRTCWRSSPVDFKRHHYQATEFY
jgi:hypothetical protein